MITERLRRRLRAGRHLAAGLLAFACLQGVAQASQTAKLSASFTPDRLGVNTTFAFAFTLGTTSGQIPSPLTSLGLRLPAGLGLFTSTLGEEICRPAALLAGGVTGCPPDAVMGFGTAVAKVPVGPEVLEVPIGITIIMGPPQNHHTGMLYYGEGQSAVVAELLFPSLVLGEAPPFGTLLNTAIPLTPGLPDAPDAAVTQMRAAIGPRGLLYSKRVRGKRVTFHPKGMAVPDTCPPRGFPVAATFRFQDNSSVTATAIVPCPPRSARHPRPRARAK